MPRTPRPAPSPATLCLCVLLVSCNAKPPGTVGISLPELLQRADSGAPVVETLPEPRDVATKKVRNRHDPSQIDLIHSYRYPGLSVTVYEVSASGKRLTDRIEVTSPRYETAEGLRIGSTEQRLLKVLGEPRQREDENYIYFTDDPAPDIRRFEVDDGKIVRMEWDYYVD